MCRVTGQGMLRAGGVKVDLVGVWLHPGKGGSSG